MLQHYDLYSARILFTPRPLLWNITRTALLYPTREVVLASLQPMNVTDACDGSMLFVLFSAEFGPLES